MSHRIVFTPSGLDGTVESGTTVLDAARKLGADIDSVCGGRGICGRCQITPSFGSFSKWGIEAVESSLLRHAPGVFVAGASWRGIGIPACVAQAEKTAQTTADFLSHLQE